MKVRTGLVVGMNVGRAAPRVEGPAEDGPGLWWWALMALAGAAWIADSWPW